MPTAWSIAKKGKIETVDELIFILKQYAADNGGTQKLAMSSDMEGNSFYGVECVCNEGSHAVIYPLHDIAEIDYLESE